MKKESDLFISVSVDKEPYIKEITKDKIINLTGESGSGKSFYVNQFKENDNYIIIDTDILSSDKVTNDKDILKLREKIKIIYSHNIKDLLISNFDDCYKIILNYFKYSDKTIIIDSAQFRNVKDLSILKGKIIVLRTCIDKCYERCIDRYKKNFPDFTEKELEEYKNKKIKMYLWYKSLNQFISKIDNL